MEYFIFVNRCFIFIGLCVMCSLCDVGWPSGNYTLLMPVTGCPVGMKSNGIVNITGNSSIPLRHSTLHLKTQLGNSFMTMRFCAHNSKSSDYNQGWPKGRYCIFSASKETVGEICPRNFSSGSISWYSPELKTIGEDIPRGNYTKPHLKISTCCKTDNIHYSDLINLSIADTNFYLMAYGSKKCQQVKGAKAELEFVEFTYEKNTTGDVSGEHPFNMKTHPRRLYLCYYTKADKETSTSSLSTLPATTSIYNSLQTSKFTATPSVSYSVYTRIPEQNVSTDTILLQSTLRTQIISSETLLTMSTVSASLSTLSPWSPSGVKSTRSSRTISYSQRKPATSGLLLSTITESFSVVSTVSAVPSSNITKGESEKQTGPSKALLIGCSLGSFLCVVLILGLVIYFCRRKKNRSSNDGPEEIPLWILITRPLAAWWHSRRGSSNINETSFLPESINAFEPLLTEDDNRSGDEQENMDLETTDSVNDEQDTDNCPLLPSDRGRLVVMLPENEPFSQITTDVEPVP